MKVLRFALVVLLGWCALTETLVLFVQNVFGFRIDGDWFLIVAASSPSEILEFSQTYSKELTLAAALLLLALATIVGMSFFAKRRVWYVWLAFVVAYVGWNCRSVSHVISWVPAWMAFDTVRGFVQYRELIDAGRWSEDMLLSRPADPATATNVVFVIGESMTTDRMSLYGYRKPTTPCLDRRREQLTVMGPVRATHASTVRAVRMMLTRATEANPNQAIETAAVAFRRRGYCPILLSAQPKWGRYCGIEHRIFAACETQTYLSDSERGHAVPDEELIRSLQLELSLNVKRPFIAFLHLQGSHFDPKWRVPPDFVTPGDFDDYDRSICYTDHVLERLIQSLPPRTLLVYTSDHGESPESGSWRNSRSPSIWKVPFVIWPKIEGVRTISCLDQVFDLMMEMMGFEPECGS